MYENVLWLDVLELLFCFVLLVMNGFLVKRFIKRKVFTDSEIFRYFWLSLSCIPGIYCRKSTVEVCSSYSHHVHLSNRSASRKLGWRKSIWRRYLHGFRVISFLFRRSYTISRLQKITSKAGQKAGLLIFYDMPAQQFVLESFIFLKQVVTDSKTFVDLFER